MQIENPSGLESAREFLRPLFESREHWMFIADGPAMAVVSRIAQKYYDGAPSEDFAAIPAAVNDESFVIVAARKKRLLGYRLNSLFRQMTGIRMTDREIAARDLFIVAEPKRLDAGTGLAEALFDDPDAERGDPGDVLTIDGRLAVAE
jgi:hypothetical protein